VRRHRVCMPITMPPNQALGVDKSEEHFHLPLQSPVVWLPALAYVALALYAWPNTVLVAIILAKGTLVIAVLRIAIRLTVSDEGVRINWFKRMLWSEVATARPTSFLGLPYLLVYLHTGFYKRYPLYVPLYVRGRRTVEAALVERAPTDNPLRTYAQSRIHA
jgi:hypothetical protein